MARQVYRYQQFNETPDKPLGILLPFNKNAGGSRLVTTHYSGSAASGKGVFLSSYSTQEQAMSNVKNLILTQKGERIFQPNFGTDIQKSLFENNTPDLEIELEDNLRADLEFWLPYIIINEIDIIRKVDEYTFILKLSFSVSESSANQTIIIFATPENISVAENDIDVQTASVAASPIGGGY